MLHAERVADSLHGALHAVRVGKRRNLVGSENARCRRGRRAVRPGGRHRAPDVVAARQPASPLVAIRPSVLTAQRLSLPNLWIVPSLVFVIYSRVYETTDGRYEMSTYEHEFAALARAMQDFFDAVDWRTEPSVQEAAVEAEAFHGPLAAIETVVRACEHLRRGEPEESAFWMKVYGVLVAPEPSVGGHVTLH